MTQDQTDAIHHSDHPTLIDKLDRAASIKNKAIQIFNCAPPQVFGVHGDWGSGKTSYLQQLRFHLDGQCPENSQETTSDSLPKAHYKDKVITIWFDAWRYPHEKAPIIALLHEIRSQFSTLDKFKKSAGKIGNVTINALLNGFSDVAKLLSLETIPVDVKRYRKSAKNGRKSI
jgi:predicted KAP-like P-loop ATPase